MLPSRKEDKEKDIVGGFTSDYYDFTSVIIVLFTYLPTSPVCKPSESGVMSYIHTPDTS